MTEKEILQDALIASKFMLSMYNQFGLECGEVELRNLFNKQRGVVSEHNYQIFTTMKEKGLYPITEAEEQNIEQAIKMHTEMQKELDKKK